MADLVFARYTNAILNMLPYWFQIRKYSKDSIGARFLNVCGLELDDMRYVIDYAYRQCYVNTLDMDQADFCYKVILPMPFKSGDIKGVFANNVGLSKVDTVREFFGVNRNGIVDTTAYSFETYYVDTKRNIIYVRKKFNVDAINNNGKIRIVFKDDKEQTYKLMPHHVWNFFDEIGNLLSCPRLPEESNFDYGKRIVDVFINPAGASKPGLINGIGRELSLRRFIHWDNPMSDIELKDSMIVLNSITIDKQPVQDSSVFITDVGTVLLKASDVNKYIPIRNHVVSYVHGLEMHQLHNKDDIKLYNELFTAEHKAKNRLKKYISILNSESPIFWDSFHWNEHYWDQNASDVSGVGYIPHLYDGYINGFSKYGLIEYKPPKVVEPPKPEPISLYLKTLSLLNGKLEPEFNPYITDYVATLPEDAVFIEIPCTLADNRATFSSTVGLASDGKYLIDHMETDTFVISCFSRIEYNEIPTIGGNINNMVREYRFKIVKEKVDKVSLRLSQLEVSPGVLTPAFDPNIARYNITVPKGTTHLKIIAKCEDQRTDFTINGGITSNDMYSILNDMIYIASMPHLSYLGMPVEYSNTSSGIRETIISVTFE